MDEERLHLKQRLAAAFRLFGRFGFDEGVAGHITARDPEHPDHFWVNPFGDELQAHHGRRPDPASNHQGEVVEGDVAGQPGRLRHPLRRSTRPGPTCIAAAHSHSVYGKAWSTLGRLLDPLTQDACAFYEDHALFDDYTGVVLDLEEGKRIAHALGDNKAAILRNHGLLTVGHSVDEAVWWFITMERTCQAQLLARGRRRARPHRRTRWPRSPPRRSAATSPAGSASSRCSTGSSPTAARPASGAEPARRGRRAA